MKKVSIYTDGAAKGNPGPGGYGTIVAHDCGDGTAVCREYSQGFCRTTNNRMELLAAIIGLESLQEPAEVTITSDSKYLVDAFKQNWIANWIRKGWHTSTGADVKNIDLWKRMLSAIKGHQVTFVWVKGHNCHSLNERCDYLASCAACSDSLKEDVVLTKEN